MSPPGPQTDEDNLLPAEKQTTDITLSMWSPDGLAPAGPPGIRPPASYYPGAWYTSAFDPLYADQHAPEYRDDRHPELESCDIYGALGPAVTQCDYAPWLASDHGTSNKPGPQTAPAHAVFLSDSVSHPSPRAASPPASPRPDPEPADTNHAYQRLPATPKSTIDKYLEPCMREAKRAYRCTWAGCSKAPFMGHENARVHVHKHLGTDKLFACVTCGQEFAAEDAAKRHRDTQDKTFSCEFCLQKFARKDYRDLHQKKCLSWTD